MEAARLGRTVGRKPAFSATDVVRAALDEGVDSFTMTAVANRLGVVTAAIYRVFGSREELVFACLDAIAATFRVPEDGADWRGVLHLWADEGWRLCEENPGLDRAVYDYPAAFTRIEDVFAAYARALAVHGWTRGQAAFALDFIGDTVFSTHIGVQAHRAVDEDGVSGLERARARSTAAAVLQPSDDWQDRGALDVKLAFVIRALDADRPSL
jgi:AcrR family transcriptional regulator